MIKIAASILACNTAYLGDAVLKAERGKADIIHIDIMDGRYVNNLTFGPQTVRDLKKITNIPLDVHLEISNANELFGIFAEAGADIITFQLDHCLHPIRTFTKVKKYGKKVGLAINPSIGIEQLNYIAEYLDYVLIMGVEPGFGGQHFEITTFKKVEKVKKILKRKGIDIPIAVDGGINLDIAKKLKKVGVDIFIIGSSLFAYDDIGSRIAVFKNV